MTTLAHILQQNFAEFPERPAVHLQYNRQPDYTVTYRALMQGAAGYARALGAAGVTPGEVVVLILQHGEALVYSFFGAILHGAIPSIMPFLTEKLTPDKYRQDLAALVEVTRPAAIVTYPEFVPEVQAALRSGGPVRAVLVSADVQPAADPDLSTMPGPRRAPDDVVLLQHSSGTTGLQKGVALSHRAVLSQLECYSKAIRLTLDDVVVSWLPLYHDMGLIAGFVMPILSRAPLVLMSPFDWVRAPGRLMQAVSRYRGTLSWLPNFAYNFCAQKTRDRELEGVDLSSWRAVVNCSEPMHWKSHQMFLERFEKYGLRPSALATCYAMAENVFAVTQGGIDAPVVVDSVDQRSLLIERRAVPTLTPGPSPFQGEGSTPLSLSGRGDGGEGRLRLLSCGQPLPNVRVRVLDDQRRDLPERHLGEIALQSDCMLTGYYHCDDATAKAFHEGWYLTGDLGYVADGEVYVTGRKKDLIIVGGKNVYPQDLEQLAGDVEGVHAGRVVAFGVFDEEMGTEEVVVVAEADADNPAARQRLADEVRQRVTRGSDVALRHVHVVGPRWLLKTSSGKIARAANREKYLAEREH